MTINANLFGFARVSTPKQAKKGSLSKQENKIVNFGVPRKNLLSLVGSAKRSPGFQVKGKRRPPANTQRQMEAHLDSLPPGAVLVLPNSSRFSRDYHWAVRVINAFYARGGVITLLNWPHRQKGETPTPFKILDLHLFYDEIYKNQLLAQRVAVASAGGIRNALNGGRYKGSQKKLSPHQLLELKGDLEGCPLVRGKTLRILGKKYDISRVTLYRYRVFIRDNLA